jgi:hypothetical protein
MTPLTITKDEYTNVWIAWYLPKDKTVELNSESKSQVFWKCTNLFYLLGIGQTKEQAETNLKRHVTEFTDYLLANHEKLSVYGISSNLPEYRQAIYDFNKKHYRHIDNFT